MWNRNLMMLAAMEEAQQWTLEGEETTRHTHEELELKASNSPLCIQVLLRFHLGVSD
jgi:hypothetical protein